MGVSPLPLGTYSHRSRRGALEKGVGNPKALIQGVRASLGYSQHLREKEDITMSFQTGLRRASRPQTHGGYGRDGVRFQVFQKGRERTFR